MREVDLSPKAESDLPLERGHENSHQQNFHEPPFNLCVESQSVFDASFGKGHSKSVTCWPFFLHVGAMRVMQFPPLSRIEKDIFLDGESDPYN